MIKSILLGISLVFYSILGFSQSGHIIIENTNNANPEQFNKNLEKCNFDFYRMYSQNRILKFDNGISISLISAEEIIEAGGFIKVSELTKDNQPVIHPVLFHIDSNGNIMQRYNNTDNRTNKINSQQEQ